MYVQGTEKIYFQLYTNTSLKQFHLLSQPRFILFIDHIMVSISDFLIDVFIMCLDRVFGV